jgi:hypothetical protein
VQRVRAEGAVALVIGAFGVSFVGGMQTGGKPAAPAKTAEQRAQTGLALADALPLPTLGTEAPQAKRRIVKAKPEARKPVERVRAPAPAPAAPAAPRVVVAPRYVPPVAKAPAPAATPAPAPRATPAPTFDDKGTPSSGDFDYGDGQ